ncbi:MAG: B12-binding domain-containing radical SAM protein [Candidatus Omnitrophica bacterium]|nr:B12-binding domain-containing radical SAM protein [Candidatus Omnitrophota bacterium]
MKVLLVKPYNISDHVQPPLGLGYLASSIRKDHQVVILDCIKEDIRSFGFAKFLDRIKPDLVGFQCYTYDILNIQKMLGDCKKRCLITAAGGPHCSAMPLETMDIFGSDLDFLFQGEAEIGFKKLLDKLSGKQKIEFEEIGGLVWRKDGKVFINDKYFLEDIDSLGMPAWDLIKPQEYPQSQHGAFFKKFPIAPIVTTRGCPFYCTFCAAHLVAGRKLRKRKVESVIKEIKMLYDNHGIREFHIVDDNFTMDKSFAKDFLIKFKELNLDVSLAVPNGVRIDTLDEEMLGLMKQAGIYLITLGIESGSDRVLKFIRKSLTTEKVRRVVKLIRGYGIDIAGLFMLGFPGETLEEMRKTIKLSRELDLIRASFFTYLPLPGTEGYNDLKIQNKFDDKLDFKYFCFMKASFTPEGIDERTLKRIQKRALLGFFLRPRVFFRNLTQIKSLSHLKFLLRRVIRWVFLR